jgi:hypothetical protein
MKGKRKDSESKVVSASETARPSDAELLILAVNRLLALGLDKKNRASAGAGWLLAYVDALIAADRKKLCETNETYRQERRQVAKSLRRDVWFPKSPLYQALHRELWHCWFYRGELHCPLVQVKWGAEEYRTLMKLDPLSLRSLPLWEPKLWKLVRKHNPDLVVVLRQRADRKQVVPVQSGGVTKHLLKPLNLTLKLVRSQFHRHLKSIATACG